MPLAPVIATQLTTPVLEPEKLPVRYQVQAFEFADSTTFGIGNLIADLHQVKNIGYADSANEVPEFFFTVDQDDPDLPLLADYLGRCHIRILRNGRTVAEGWLMESDEQDDDVVFYGYGYLAALYWLLSDWKDEHISKSVSAIVQSLWYRAKSGLTQSPLGFVATGALEGAYPATGSTAGQIELAHYALFYKRLLFAMQELAALGASDTTNNVIFEIAHGDDAPVFNFWANKGLNRANVRLTYGDGAEIIGFKRERTPVFHRNDIKAVGSLAYNALARTSSTDDVAISTYGRRQEPLYLAWVRDQTELERVVNFRKKFALREETNLTLRLRPGAIVPPGGYGAQVEKGDRVKVEIDRGITQIDNYLLLVGWMVVYDGEEHINLIVRDSREESPAQAFLLLSVTNDTKYNAFPGLSRLSNGNLVVGYYKATDHDVTRDGIVVVRTSANNGTTWTAEVTVYDDPSLDVRGCEIVTLANGDLLLAMDTWDGTANGFVPYVTRSTDNGATWSTKVAVTNSFGYVAAHHVGKIIELDNGHLLYPLYGKDTAGGSLYSVVLKSTDGGATWGSQVTIAQLAGRDYVEPFIQRLADGELLCLIRENQDQLIYSSRSTDDGATWSTPVAEFDGQSKPAFAELNDGTLLYAGRANPNGDTIFRLSRDRGVTWTEEETIDSAGVRSMYASVIPVDDGGAWIAYGHENSATDSDIKLERFYG